MKSFTDFKDFHKLNFMKTSQLSEICGTGFNTPYCTKLRKLKLCDFKQLSQHQMDNRWCSLNSDLGYWLQIHNFFHNSLHQTECCVQICHNFFLLLPLAIFPLLPTAVLLLLRITLPVSLHPTFSSFPSFWFS